MNKKIKKTLMSILGLAAVVVPTSMVLTSCGGSSYLTKDRYNLVQQVKNPKIRNTNTNNTESSASNNGLNNTIIGSKPTDQSIVLNPNINTDAIDIIESTIKNNRSKKILQNEFTKITPFYHVYENEVDTNGTEIESELISMTVTNPGEWNNTTNQIENIGLELTWEVETESNKLKDSDEKKEIKKTTLSNFVLKPRFASFDELSKIVFNVEKKQNTTTRATASNEYDLDDVYKLYVGEKGKPSIFKDVLDKMTTSSGGLVGWNLNLTQIENAVPSNSTNNPSFRSKKPNVVFKYDVKNIFAPSNLFNGNSGVVLPDINGGITITPTPDNKPVTPPSGSDGTPSNPGDSNGGSQTPDTTPPTQNQPKPIDLSLNFQNIELTTFDEIKNITAINNTSSTIKTTATTTPKKATALVDLFNEGEKLSSYIDQFRISVINNTGGGTSGNSFVSKDILNEETLIIDIQFKGNLNSKDIKVATVCIPKSWCNDSSNQNNPTTPNTGTQTKRQ